MDLRGLLRALDVRSLLSGDLVLCLDLPRVPCLTRVSRTHLMSGVAALLEGALASLGTRGVVMLRLEQPSVRDGVPGPWLRMEVSDSGPARDGGGGGGSTVTAWLPAAAGPGA